MIKKLLTPDDLVDRLVFLVTNIKMRKLPMLDYQASEMASSNHDILEVQLAGSNIAL